MSWAEDEGHDEYFFAGDRTEEIKLKFLNLARQTEKAWLITFEIDEKFKPVQCWLPKSQCFMDKKNGIIYVPAWLVEENELESYRG